jgi:hypothetical protein
MAQKVQIMLEDDLDGSEATETISFSLDGASYEIDLNDTHAAELRDVFAPYVGAGRRAGRSAGSAASRRSAGRTGGNGDKQRVQEIREWARTHGHKVSERGRLSAAVVEAYKAAH